MSRIARCFDTLTRDGRKGLITFITAGDPSASETVEWMHALVRGGADIVELGVPFSDPMADGETIQRASERALSHGFSLNDVLNTVREFRQRDQNTPVVLMGYLNPFEHMGAKRFAALASSAGVDGVLVVDLPPEEAVTFNAEVTAEGLDQVFLVAPNSPPARMRQVCSAASGFVYFVSVKGVTGTKAAAMDEVSACVAEIRKAGNLPIGIGFGIRTAASAVQAAHLADAVIVGSAIVELIENGGGRAAVSSAIEDFVTSLRSALDDIPATEPA